MTEILSKLKQDLITEIEHRIDLWLEENDVKEDACGFGKTTRDDAIDYVTEAFLCEMQDAGLYDFFEYIISKEYAVKCDKNNSYLLLEQPKKENIIYPFGIDMDVDMSFLNIRK